MEKWHRLKYQPVLPLGENGEMVTGSAEHIALSRRAAAEGMVSMDTSIYELYEKGIITEHNAIKFASNADLLKKKIEHNKLCFLSHC